MRYGGKYLNRGRFIAWDQVREVAASGLVEIASHSNNLHKGILANKQGNLLPAAITHLYDPTTDSYEDEKSYRARLYADLKANNDLIAKNAGAKVRVMVWPFGRYNQSAVEVAEQLGMKVILTLDPVPGSVDQLNMVGRFYPVLNPEAGLFRGYIEPDSRPSVKRFLKYPAKALLEKPGTEEPKLSSILERVKAIGPGVAVLEPVLATPSGVKALFPTSQLPLAQDRLLRGIWQVSRRGGSEVHLWLGGAIWGPGGAEGEAGVKEMLGDMGRFAPGSGVVVEDPALIRALVSANLLKGHEPSQLAWNPARSRKARKALLKTPLPARARRVLGGLEAFQYWQPFLEVSLLIPAAGFMGLAPAELSGLLNIFDRLVLDLRRSPPPELEAIYAWLGQARIKPLLPFISCILSFAPKGDAEGLALAKTIKRLSGAGLTCWGYEYDDPDANLPPSQAIAPFMSVRSYPFRKP